VQAVFVINMIRKTNKKQKKTADAKTLERRFSHPKALVGCTLGRCNHKKMQPLPQFCTMSPQLCDSVPQGIAQMLNCAKLGQGLTYENINCGNSHELQRKFTRVTAEIHA